MHSLLSTSRGLSNCCICVEECERLSSVEDNLVNVMAVLVACVQEVVIS